MSYRPRDLFWRGRWADFLAASLSKNVKTPKKALHMRNRYCMLLRRVRRVRPQPSVTVCRYSQGASDRAIVVDKRAVSRAGGGHTSFRQFGYILHLILFEKESGCPNCSTHLSDTAVSLKYIISINVMLVRLALSP